MIWQFAAASDCRRSYVMPAYAYDAFASPRCCLLSARTDQHSAHAEKEAMRRERAQVRRCYARVTMFASCHEARARCVGQRDMQALLMPLARYTTPLRAMSADVSGVAMMLRAQARKYARYAARSDAHEDDGALREHTAARYAIIVITCCRFIYADAMPLCRAAPCAERTLLFMRVFFDAMMFSLLLICVTISAAIRCRLCAVSR